MPVALLENKFGGIVLKIGWIAKLAQNPLDQHAQLGLHRLFHLPIDRDVITDLHQTE